MGAIQIWNFGIVRLVLWISNLCLLDCYTLSCSAIYIKKVEIMRIEKNIFYFNLGYVMPVSLVTFIQF